MFFIMKTNQLLRLSYSIAAVSMVSYPVLAEDLSHKTPNILIIQTDELSFRTIGAYRNILSKEQAEMWGEGNVVTTPNLDKLASDGILCSEFYTNCPQSAPSRACFITGLYNQNNGVIVNGIGLDDKCESFADVLCDNGYKTGYAGKWHLASKADLPGWDPEPDFGFTDNKYMYNNGHWKKMMLDSEGNPHVAVKDKNGRPSVAVANADSKSYTTDFLTSKTIEFIKENGKKPFCFMLSIPDPHGPNTVREPYASMYQKMDFKKPRTWTGNGKGMRTIKPAELAIYFGMVKCIDDNLGRIIKTLKDKGIYDNTIIVFTADHGDMLGEHDRDDKGVSYEASMKIPFIISCPKLLPQGKVIKNVMSTVDFKPTLLGLLGMTEKKKSDGTDYSDILLKGMTDEDYSNVAFCRGPAMRRNDNNGFICVVSERYKLECNTQGKINALYDKVKDPDEMINFAEDPAYSNIVKDMLDKLYEYGEKYGDARVKKVNF